MLEELYQKLGNGNNQSISNSNSGKISQQDRSYNSVKSKEYRQRKQVKKQKITTEIEEMYTKFQQVIDILELNASELTERNDYGNLILSLQDSMKEYEDSFGDTQENGILKKRIYKKSEECDKNKSLKERNKESAKRSRENKKIAHQKHEKIYFQFKKLRQQVLEVCCHFSQIMVLFQQQSQDCDKINTDFQIKQENSKNISSIKSELNSLVQNDSNISQSEEITNRNVEKQPISDKIDDSTQYLEDLENNLIFSDHIPEIPFNNGKSMEFQAFQAFHNNTNNSNSFNNNSNSNDNNYSSNNNNYNYDINQEQKSLSQSGNSSTQIDQSNQQDHQNNGNYQQLEEIKDNIFEEEIAEQGQMDQKVHQIQQNRQFKKVAMFSFCIVATICAFFNTDRAVLGEQLVQILNTLGVQIQWYKTDIFTISNSKYEYYAKKGNKYLEDIHSLNCNNEKKRPPVDSPNHQKCFRALVNYVDILKDKEIDRKKVENFILLSQQYQRESNYKVENLHLHPDVQLMYHFYENSEHFAAEYYEEKLFPKNEEYFQPVVYKGLKGLEKYLMGVQECQEINDVTENANCLNKYINEIKEIKLYFDNHTDNTGYGSIMTYLNISLQFFWLKEKDYNTILSDIEDVLKNLEETNLQNTSYYTETKKLKAVILFEQFHDIDNSLQILREVIKMETDLVYPGLFRFKMTMRYMKKLLYWKIISDNLEIEDSLLQKLKRYADFEYNKLNLFTLNQTMEDREYLDYLEQQIVELEKLPN